MEDIKKIVIKGTSGYCTFQYVFRDKVTITPESISYECIPMYEESIIKNQKWSYRTNNPLFTERFNHIASDLMKKLSEDQTELWEDVGAMEFEITTVDNIKYKETYYVLGEYFHDVFMDIKELIPNTEMIPEVLKTGEDYDDIEDDDAYDE